MEGFPQLNLRSCRTIRDLQSSFDSNVGVAYFYCNAISSGFDASYIDIFQFWIIQLASQCQSLPIGLLTEDLTAEDFCNKLPFAQIPEIGGEESYLISVLFSLLPIFRRTFLLIDGFETSRDIVRLTQDVLEQDLGDVSIAIFSRPDRSLEPLLDIADVSIRLTQIEPDLGQYTRYKIGRVVKPRLIAANLDYDDGFLTTIEKVISGAADGL